MNSSSWFNKHNGKHKSLSLLKTHIHNPPRFVVVKTRRKKVNLSKWHLKQISDIKDKWMGRKLDAIRKANGEVNSPLELPIEKELQEYKLEDQKNNFIDIEKKTRRSYDEPERSQAGNNVKRYHGFKCQVCEALGQNPISFFKRDGQPYAEAHHIIPLGEGGDDTEDNIVSICANHHRQIHLGDVYPAIIYEDKFILIMDGKELSLKRWRG